jgi:hypothetical protein
VLFIRSDLFTPFDAELKLNDLDTFADKATFGPVAVAGLGRGQASGHFARRPPSK